MTFSTDALLDRMNLKSQVKKWRAIAILLVTILTIVAIGKTADPNSSGKPFIAKVEVQGIILEDKDRRDALKKIASNESAKALILYINSPGGTMVGGEELYRSIKEISAKKPVVAVMGSMATSGGYMASIAADHIVASAGTITGSVGVILQSAQITDLAKKLGIKFVNFKSGSLKASPSPVENISDEARKMIDETINDSFKTFLSMVVESRKLNRSQINTIKNGRIFTGRQAKEISLVDEIGNETEALAWLQKNKSINKKLRIIDVNINPEKSILDGFYSKIFGNGQLSSVGNSGGIMAIWNPSTL